MRPLNLGIIGCSEGNGHPYSWSAIFNGYDATVMKTCPYPSIYNYLSRQTFPDDAIADAKVTHIWTQDKRLSVDIAAASYIENIVDDYRDLLGQVDGILLARDDAENHLKFSRLFLEAGIPIYIDKPLALTQQNAKKLILSSIKSNSLFSCSALRYADEVFLDENIGQVSKIVATVGKSWEKYAVHIIEPVLLQMEPNLKINDVKKIKYGDCTTLSVTWSNGLQTMFTTLGNVIAPISFEFYGTKGHRRLCFEDSFNAFKKALLHFVSLIKNNGENIEQDFMLKVVNIIELGL